MREIGLQLEVTITVFGKLFNQFIIRLDEKPSSWEDRLVLFVGYLIKEKKKSGTIKSYISEIRSVLKEDGEILNENKFLLTSLTKACRFINDHVRIRLPIRKNLLVMILESVHLAFAKHNQQPFLNLLYQALFSTAYFGLFRVGELTESQHVIKAKDVHVGKNKMKMMFVLHTSKTHWFDKKPQTVKIASQQSESPAVTRNSRCNFCPFTLLQNYIAARGPRETDHEQFFVFRDKSPVTANNFRIILRKVLQELKLDPMVYGTQSLRAGRACDLAQIGIEIPKIQFLGRWSSGAIYTYLKH